MCGIAGQFGVENREQSQAAVSRMVDAMARRGPDGSGVHGWDRATLGHRRLSIFDLSAAGRQPMLTEDGETGVAFNGAIYNFRALRAELEHLGCRFRSQTDTEVLLHGYRQWGIEELVRRLRGMFAVGLWDNRSGKGYLFRDRLGVKPLVYSERHGQLLFASTVRALRDGGGGGELDPLAMLEYLEYGYVSDVRGIYQGVHKIPAGGILEWSNGRIRQWEYWQLPAVERSRITFEEAVEETERIFVEAVKLRLDADVPVGALLSGGVDSSLVCWAIAKLGADIQAFTVGTKGDPSDETADATATAQQLGIRHQVIDLSGEQEPDIADLVTAYGEPFSCASALGMLKVCRAVKPSATVLLTGDGGDDVFLGYPEHQHLYRASQLAHWLPPGAPQLWQASQGLLPDHGFVKRGRNFLNYATGGLGAVISAHDGLPRYEAAGVLGERLRGLKLAQRQTPWRAGAGRDVLTDFLRYDRAGRFVGEYMTKVDGGAMHWAVEARGPLLDAELWDFAARLPYGLRLTRGRSKAILRELARRHLGDRVAFGAKRGFTIPVTRWLREKWRPRWEQSMHDGLLTREGWLSAKRLRGWWESSCQTGNLPMQFWHLLVLENWLRNER